MVLLCVGSEGVNKMNIQKRIPKMVAEPIRAIFAWRATLHSSGADPPVTTLPLEPEKDLRESACWQQARPHHVSWTAIQDCKEKTLLRLVTYPRAF